jgi:dihydrofolate reductase
MRKIISHMHVTLDGFAAGPKGEMDWIKLDDEMFDFVKTLTDNADTALYGRVTWQMMDNYWPEAGKNPDASKHDKEHSEWYNSVNKYVLSNSMKNEKRNKTFFVGGDVGEQIRVLKQKEGGDILLLGSPSVVRTLMKENLIDEYWLFINPVILGKGISMFVELNDRIELTHKMTKSFKCGSTALKFIQR